MAPPSKGGAESPGRAEARAGVEVISGGSTLPSTTMDAPQRLQWIRTFLSWMRSSETAYLAGHCPHCTFMAFSSGTRSRERTVTLPSESS